MDDAPYLKNVNLSEPTQRELLARLGSDRARKYLRFAAAALGSIPWVGGFIAASASFSAEKDQQAINDLQRLWLEEHRAKTAQLADTLAEIFARLDGFGEEVQKRLESDEYLSLVKKAFRQWDEADTAGKKEMFQRLITNAGATTLCTDDLVRLFLHWIDLYHETHFVVMRVIYRNPGISRGRIWQLIHGPKPREDSSEADLFRYLIRDLSTGGVIRQARDTDDEGRFLKHVNRSGAHHAASRTMESSFDENKPYVLTELGKQFVHYVMNDVAPQIGG